MSGYEIQPAVQAAPVVSVGAWECELATQALTWTPGVFNIFGLADQRKVDRRETVAMYSEESREAMEWLRAEAIVLRRGFTLDAEIVRHDGKRRWMRLTAEISCANGRPSHLYGLKDDITEERLRLQTMQRASDQDGLTGLAGRSLFDSRFRGAACAAPKVWPLGALVMVQIDGLDRINALHGYDAGDACLQVAASALTTGFRDALMIARIGGDRFAVLTRAYHPVDRLQRDVARWLARLALPRLQSGRSVTFGASAGIATAHNPFSYDAEAMFAAADGALAIARQEGAGAVCTAGMMRQGN